MLSGSTMCICEHINRDCDESIWNKDHERKAHCHPGSAGRGNPLKI